MIATLLDGAIIAVAMIGLGIVTAILGRVSDTLGGLFAVLVYAAGLGLFFYYGYLEGERGTSPAKAILGLKIVSDSTGQVVGGGQGIIRRLAHFIDSAICYIGYLFPLWDPKRQTIADKIMTTVVLRDQEKRPFGPDLFTV